MLSKHLRKGVTTSHTGPILSPTMGAEPQAGSVGVDKETGKVLHYDRAAMGNRRSLRPLKPEAPSYHVSIPVSRTDFARSASAG